MATKWEVFFIPLCRHTKPVPKPKTGITKEPLFLAYQHFKD